MISVQRLEDLIVPRLLWLDLAEGNRGDRGGGGGQRCERFLACALNSPQLTIRRILVQHERTTGLRLRLEDGIPELLRLDHLLELSLTLVRLVQLVERLSM